MEILFDVLRFALKGAVVVVAVLIMAGGIAALVRRGRRDEARLVVSRLNSRFSRLADSLRSVVLGRGPFKKHRKLARRARQRRAAARRAFVLDFHGDIAATAVASLREEVTAVLQVARPEDEVILRLESSGGVVHAYGLAASQLARIKNKGLRLVVCVDRIAASGGYMMACLADELMAAPFAIIGSIGVVAPLPNLHRLLEKHGIDYEEMTAGEFKRTTSVLGKISPEGREKLREQIEETHELFKSFVREHRPALDIEAVATGEHWFATRARELALVDRLSTSDDYLLMLADDVDLFHVAYKSTQPWRQRLAASVAESTARVVVSWLTKLRSWGHR